MPVWGLIINSPPLHSQNGHSLGDKPYGHSKPNTTLNSSHLNLDQMAQAPNYIQLVFLKGDCPF